MNRRKFTASFKLNSINLGIEKQNVAQAARVCSQQFSRAWKGEND